MPWRKRITPAIVAELDTLELSAIAEYLCRRHDVARKLTFLFGPDGRYDRVIVDGKRPRRALVPDSDQQIAAERLRDGVRPVTGGERGEDCLHV